MNLKLKMLGFAGKYDSLIIFLVIECLALTAFSLADANIVFRYLGFLVSLTLIPYVLLFTTKKELTSLLIFSIPLLVVAILTSFSTFTSVMGYGILDNLSVLLGTIAFFFLGFAVRRIKSFKIDIVLLTIGAAMGLLVLMSLIYTLFSYGPFYAHIYRDMVYYYDGRLFIVSDETKWLLGFSFVEISKNYAALFGTILTSALVGLLFISPIKEPRKFALTAVIGTIGLASIVLIPNLNALYFLIPLALFALLYRFLPKREKAGAIVQYAFYALLGIGGVALVIAVMNASGVDFVANAISGSALLNKIFNANRIMAPINAVLASSLRSGGLFGFPLTFLDGLFAATGAFEFEIIKEGGLIAFLALLAFMILIVFSLFRYSAKSKDSRYVKAIIITILLGVLLNGSFIWETFPLVHGGDYYYSFFRSAPYLLVLFFLGYAYYPLRLTPTIETEHAFESAPVSASPSSRSGDEFEPREEEIRL